MVLTETLSTNDLKLGYAWYAEYACLRGGTFGIWGIRGMRVLVGAGLCLEHFVSGECRVCGVCLFCEAWTQSRAFCV